MSAAEDRGMSLEKVALLAFALVTYFLWGGAAAIYQAHLDETAVAPVVDAGEPPNGNDDHPADDSAGLRIRPRRGAGLVAVVVVTLMAIWTFVANSVVHLASIHRLIPYLLTEHIWYPVFSAVVLGVVGLGYWWMSRLQADLESGNPFQRGRPRKKLPKIRIPKPTDL
ncbi:MAG: hypothetical protein DWH91_03050 [Planctomycetota bacterium]|nr:MAG: hypothetical protein DWH91_03050 [Planctomycetota bacterium]